MIRRLLLFVFGMACACACMAAQPATRADPFPGRSEVRVWELFAFMQAQADEAARSPVVRRDYDALLRDNAIAGDAALYRDYVRIKLAFEATRAGGLWGLHWKITDQQPQSDRVWQQWRALQLDERAPLPYRTAVAECDELSALFAVVAKGTGLSKRSEVGLLWPYPNHTVAVWTIDRGTRAEKRIVVPTSQIFLDGNQSLGTRIFDPWRQKQVFGYRRQDVAPNALLPAPLARRFAWAVADHRADSQVNLQAQRNWRESRQ
jgi:hypothetical protein